MEQQIRFCTTSDGIRIAYATVGSGPAYVWVPPLTSHLELSWETPQLRSVWEAYAQDFTVVRYDKRGSGLSDRNIEDYSVDARIRDLEAVRADLELPSIILRGQSEGGPVAIAYAARHPEIVSRLVLFGTYASGPELAALRKDVGEAVLAMIQAEWGIAAITLSSMINPDLPPDAAARQGASIAPEHAAAMIRSMVEVDVSPVLADISMPTLVVHGRDDQAIPFELGRRLASSIPDARLFAYEGGHNPMEPKVLAEVRAVVREFISAGALQSTERAVSATRDIHTILFTDIADSTALTQRLGDAQAQELVRAHNTIVREALAAHGGTEIKHTGDGIMASFPTASGALECAVAIQRGVALRREPNLQVHVGVNAGEPVAEESDLFGTAVQLARRICDHAEAGQVLASNVVRELAAGKGFLFGDIGEVALRGFEDPVRLYEVRWRPDERSSEEPGPP